MEDVAQCEDPVFNLRKCCYGLDLECTPKGSHVRGGGFWKLTESQGCYTHQGIHPQRLRAECTIRR